MMDIYGISMSYNPDMAKATKVLVTMPDELLERIDRETKSLGQTRSDFLQEAARRRLGWPDPAAVDAALERGRTALAGLGGFESAELIRSEREERDARDQRR
jgi:Arc/MetJ-type ribon-helix-helix transcriptional regulator